MKNDKSEGVLEDDKEAVKWFGKTAEAGFAYAQYKLGHKYGDGEGVLRDSVTPMRGSALQRPIGMRKHR